MRFAPLFLLLATVLLAACDSGPGESLYDPDRPSLPDPVISGVVTDDPIVLAGIDEIIIEGSNFSSVPSENFVYFEDGAGGVESGVVLEATPTRLRVKTPNFPGSDLKIRVSVLGAENYSTGMAFALTPAVVAFSDYGPSNEVLSIASDASGDLYAMVQSEGLSVGIERVTPEGVRSAYVASTFSWSDLDIGPSGALYGARQIRALFEIPEVGGPQAVQPTAVPSGNLLGALDWDPTGRLWAGGDNAEIFRTDPGIGVTAFPFAGNVEDLVATSTSLYVADATEGAGKVWRFPIDGAGDLGAGEVLYDVTANMGEEVSPLALAVAADGTLYVGTDASDPVFTIAPSGTVTPLYPGVIPGPVTAFAWGADTTLYFLRGRIVTGTTDAPIIDRAKVFTLETRRMGGASRPIG